MARRNLPALIEDLRRDEYYSRHNLPHREYTEDVILQWLKHHWAYLEVGREVDERLRDIWIDLSAALAALPPDQARVVTLYAEGWRDDELAEAAGDPLADATYLRGVKGMVRYLKGER